MKISDLVEDLSQVRFPEDQIRTKAYSIYKRDFSPDQMYNWYLGEKELRLAKKLKDIFNTIDKEKTGLISFDEIIHFGTFMRVEWTLSFLREAFDVLFANHDYRIPENQFLDFASSELNGMDLLLASTLMDGYITLLKLEPQHRTHLEDCFDKLDKNGSGNVPVADKFAPQFCQEDITQLYNQMDITHDGLVSFYEFMLFSSLLSKVHTPEELVIIEKSNII